jgi:hypothetical protein
MSRARFWTGWLGVGLALVGVWGAWVPHRAAALVLSSWDLAEFVKFVPGASVIRELFYLPVWCAGISLTLIANQPGRKLAWRVLFTLIAVALMVALLPPYPHVLTGYRSAEFRWRFLLGVSGTLAVFASWFSTRWPGRVVGLLLVGLALAGAVPALWQFLEVREAIAGVYGASIGWGWGLGVFLMGWGLVSVTGVRWFIGPGQGR